MKWDLTYLFETEEEFLAEGSVSLDLKDFKAYNNILSINPPYFKGFKNRR